ncbi:MAG: hypothetical protein LBI15_02920 [Dysgonamonadaceae bacterium]|jgi:hypothetical protein|nr:hypothetical protein [Dysgonamonadaceae bacterium]
MELFRPAWDSKKPEKAVKAVTKIKKKATLLKVARKARCWQARLAAIENKNFTDANELYYIAINEENNDVLQAAVKKLNMFYTLNDPHALFECTRKSLKENKGSATTGNVLNESTKAAIAKSVLSKDLCVRALVSITSQDLIADVAKNAHHDDIRTLATKILINESIYTS